MRFKPSMTFSVLAPALALGSFTLALQFQVSAMPVRGVDPASIDRALKGDRQPLPAAFALPQRSEQPRLPAGCVDAANWQRKTIYTAEIPGRCVG